MEDDIKHNFHRQVSKNLSHACIRNQTRGEKNRKIIRKVKKSKNYSKNNETRKAKNFGQDGQTKKKLQKVIKDEDVRR